MKKTKPILLACLLVLLVILAYMAINKSKHTSTIDISETAFAFADTGAVNKVIIEPPTGPAHTLLRQADGSWGLDNQYTLAPKQAVLLLAMLHDLEIKRPLTKAEQDTLTATKLTQATKVEVYSQGQLSHTFYAGPETPNQLGTYALLAGTAQPYVVYVRGLNQSLRELVAVDVHQWRSRQIFNSNLRGIQSVAVSYADKPDQSFEIRYKQNKFEVDGQPLTDKQKLMQYLTQYGQVRVQAFVKQNEQHLLDSLRGATPAISIALTDIDKLKTRTLLIYLQAGSRSRFVLGRTVPQNEVVLLNIAAIQPLLVTKAYFEQR